MHTILIDDCEEMFNTFKITLSKPVFLKVCPFAISSVHRNYSSVHRNFDE